MSERKEGQRDGRQRWRLSFDGRAGLAGYRCLVIFALLLAPLLWIVRLALFAPELAFLTPAWGSEWIRHPAHDVVLPGAIAEAQFVAELRIAKPGEPVVLRARAFGDMEVAVNGTPVGARDAGTSWKRSISFDLGDRMHGGVNVVSIHVANARGNPALMVEAPDSLRTPDGWTASLATTGSDRVAVVPALFRPARPGPLQRSTQWRWLAPATIVWLAGWTLAAIVAASKKWAEPIERTEAGFEEGLKAFERWLPIVFIAVALALNLSNAAHYPYARSTFDWVGHVEYVVRVAQTWAPPRASDGWEMYHPPLYYFAAAAIYRLFGIGGPEAGLKAVQMFGGAIGSLLPLVAWRQLRLLRPSDVRGTWIATALAAFLPMSLYINPLISNEAFTATLTAGAIYVALWLFVDARGPSVATTAAAGALAGAALLAKLTGLVVFLVSLGCLVVRAVNSTRVSRWRPPVVYASAALALAGWFYARNAFVYGNPFITNWDAASGFAFRQEPTFRTAGFFLSFPGIFFQHPTRSIWTSFFGGHYATVWADAHSNFFAQSDESAFLVMGISLLLGFATTVAGALRSSRNLACLMITGVVLTTWWAMFLLALRAPHYSSIKAFYWLSIVPCLAVCFAVGRARIASTSTWLGRVLDAISLGCAGLAWALYRF